MKSELDIEIKKLQREFLKILTSKAFLIYIGTIYGSLILCLCYTVLKGCGE